VKNKINKPLTYGVLSIAALLVLIPVLWMILTSFKDISEIVSGKFSILPQHFTLAAYKNIWKDYPFLTYLRNSLIVVGLSTIIALVVSSLSGYGTSRFQFKGKGGFLAFLLISQMFPAVMLLVPFYNTLKTYNLSDSLTGLTITYVALTLPFCTWMMLGYFEGIPKDLDEAAKMDGCGPFRTFFQIILPLTLPGIISTTIYALVQGWNEYMFAQTLAATQASKTLPVGIGEMVGYYKIMWNDLMAASVISSIPLILIYVFLQKYFVSDLSGGAVKG